MDWKKLAPVGLKSSFDERQRGGVGVFPCCLFVGKLLDLVDDFLASETRTFKSMAYSQSLLSSRVTVLCSVQVVAVLQISDLITASQTLK